MARPTIAGLTRELKAYKEEVSQLKEGRRSVAVLLGIPAYSDHNQIRDAIKQTAAQERQLNTEQALIRDANDTVHRREVALLRDELARLWYIVRQVVGVEEPKDTVRSQNEMAMPEDPNNWR